MEWDWEPSVIAGTIVLIGLYAYAYRNLWLESRRRGEKASLWRPVLFLAGTLTLFLSLVSPLDKLGDEYLLSAHMVQHMLLVMVVPVLWLLGLPGPMVDELLTPKLCRVLRPLVFPVTTLLVFNLVFYLWHLPALYDLALADERVHIAQHLCFIATGVLNWWPVLSPSRRLPPLNSPLRLLYLFAGGQMMSALGIVLVFAGAPFYQPYVDAPRILNITPLADQQLGGLIMWIPGDVLYLVIFSIVFLQWMMKEETDSLSPDGPSRQERRLEGAGPNGD